MNHALRVRLTGRAARFLQLLHDFGHLDEDRVTDLAVALAELSGTSREPKVDLPAVRRVAALWLFGEGAFVDGDGSMLAEDWPVLFS